MAKTKPIQWRTEKRKIGDLIEWEKNPRRLTEKQAADLDKSIDKFGYVEEIVLNFDGKSIIGGHQRRRVMMLRQKLSPDTELDCRLPDRELTELEHEELAIRLNKNQGEWDFDKLANEFDEPLLIAWGFEAPEFGIQEEEKTPHTMGDANVDKTICPACKRPF